jgi:hypothetical protein
MQVKRIVGVLTVASVLVVGCGDDGAEDGAERADEADGPSDRTGDDNEQSGIDDGAGEGAAQSPACDLLTTEEVSALFGSPAELVPGEAGPIEVASTCIWQAEVGEEATPTLYQLRLSVYEGGERFDSNLWGGNPETVDGLGDEAFLVRSGGTLGTTAGYRTGARSVFLSYAILLNPDAPDPEAQADEVVELLRTVDRRLRVGSIQIGTS